MCCLYFVHDMCFTCDVSSVVFHLRFSHDVFHVHCLKGLLRIFEKNYITDENDSLSEYNKIPLGHNRTNGAFYS